MKKLLLLLLAAFLFGCSSGKYDVPDMDFSVEIATRDVDMSGYRGVNSTKHCFREVDLYDVYDFIKEGGSGVFYLGYTDCANCQQGVRYLNEVGMELGVTVYYINIDRADYNIRGDREAYDRVLAELEPILGKEDDGEVIILTPDVFQLINGEFGKNHIGLTGSWEGTSPSEASVNQLKETYRELLTPYIR
ncbi:MAG: hypothetical protein IKE21_06715 [Erysipelotrichaceae bacterium]|nr:hypothetical protein [Erysipelotrichaceae bacterium]